MKTNTSIIILSAFISGLIAVFIDQIVRQTVIENTLEANIIPEHCIHYRRTHTHLLSLFIVGVVIFPIMYWIHNYTNAS